jgi:uncharacterized protein (DUF1778 family)
MRYAMAHPAKETRDIERFESRISAEKKSVLKNAADLSGRTLTDFVINSAYEAAIRVIQEYQQLHLSVRDREVFIQALLNPPLPADSLIKAVKIYKKSVVSK